MAGPRPLFIKAHMRRTLELVSEHEPIGRKRLARKLRVGEGSMRTILNRLKDDKLVASTPQGHILTKKGKQEFKRKPRKFLTLDAGDLTVGEVDVATIVRKASEKVKLGIRQRDEAIKAGADGATVLVFSDGRFKIPGTQIDLEPKIENRLSKAFQPTDGDVVIIGTGDTEASAERGVLAAAESLF